MLKIAIVVWMMLGTVLGGSAIIAVLATGMAAGPSRVIPLAALIGVVVAMPLSYLVAMMIGRTGPRSA
jgi:hypothetical protein